MIVRLLSVILSILLGVGIYFGVTQGFPELDIAGMKVLSYEELGKMNEDLNTKIGNLDTLNNTDFPREQTRLKQAEDEYTSTKAAYDELTTHASEEEIAAANQKEEYMLDYLWIKIGNYAEDNGVKFKLDASRDTSTLTFDITGQYVSIINFMYDLENDDELSFKLDNLIAEGGSSSDITKARFIVSGVNVITSEV